MTGASSKAAGSRFERKVASISGGKRRPLSIDDTPIGGILEPNFRIESKYGRQVPKFFYDAYYQAERGRPIGDNRPTAVVLGKAREQALFVASLDDVCTVLEALAEIGNGAKVRELLRQVRRVVDELERSVK